MWYLDVNSVKTDFLILSFPFHIHSILKLAPVLSQKSEKMHLLRTFCSSTAKTKQNHRYLDNRWQADLFSFRKLSEQVNAAIESQASLLYQGGWVCRDDFFARCYTRRGSLGLANFSAKPFYMAPAKKNDPKDFLILFSSICLLQSVSWCSSKGLLHLCTHLI